MIKLLRVDHRLLHGQVAFSWTASLGTDCILIANDSVPEDDIRKTTIKLSKPNGVKLVIKNIEDSIQSINSGITDKYKLFIIVESIHDARRLAESCPAITTVNLGGTKKTEDRKKLSKAVFANAEEADDIRYMAQKGIEVEIRQIPGDSKIKALDVL